MNKKSIVLQTTLELITSQGVAATSLSQIIKASGVANGTVYHHFKNKEEIIAELYLMLTQDFGTVIMRNNIPEDDFEKQFSVMWHNLFYYFVNNPLAFVFSEQIARSPEIPDSLKQEARKYYIEIESYFRKGIRNKIFKSYPILIMEELFFGNVVSLVKIHENESMDLQDKHLNQAVEISWKGFLRD